MPDVIRHPEAGELGAWIPAFAGMTGSYTASLFALVYRVSLRIDGFPPDDRSAPQLTETLGAPSGCVRLRPKTVRSGFLIAVGREGSWYAYRP